MTAMTPAEELRAAAAKLRNLAVDATRGPWQQSGIGEYGWGVSFGRAGAGVEADDSDQGRADAAYITAMHPGVGAAFAVLLETEAGTWAGDEVHYNCTDRTCPLEAALAVARAILGGAS